MDDMINIGQYDADQLREMDEDPKVQEMIKTKRIFLDASGGYDKGCIWVKDGDGEAYKLGCEYRR